MFRILICCDEPEPSENYIQVTETDLIISLHLDKSEICYERRERSEEEQLVSLSTNFSYFLML